MLGSLRPCLEHLQREGMQGFGNQNGGGFALGADHQRCRLAGRIRPIIQRRIGNIESGDFTHHALEFVDGLQKTLAHLSLIRCIGCYEGRKRRERLHRRRNNVVIAAATEKRDSPHVALGYGIYHPLDLILGPPMTDGNRISEQKVFSQPIKELVQ
ncbi:hypothetical protein DSECCO2_604050 [anaerobic digester metagenome]